VVLRRQAPSIERELKFSLTPAAARRIARQVGPAGAWRRRIVSNVYYDTAQERLRRAGVALRFRRDGTQPLQTLKAETSGAGGFSARAEWEMPAPRGRLDIGAFPREAILAATGLDLTRLATLLRPKFETRFARRSATVVVGRGTRVEICVDRGYVAAGKRREPISEIELELKSGTAAALLRYAAKMAKALGLALEFESKAERGYRLAAGTTFPPPRKWRRPRLGELATPGEAFGAIFAAALTQAGANARGVAQASDPEYVHQMRVGLRRLRSALLAFRALVPRKAAKPIVKRLRGLMPPLGAARDWDVLCERLARDAAPQALLARARARRASARRAAREAARSPQLQAFLLRAMRWVNEGTWSARGSLIHFAGTALERLHRKVLKEARDIDWADPERRHRVRIRIKAVRYACDFFATSFAGAAARPYGKRVETLQDVLGDLNDIAVARRLLSELAVPAGDARQLLAARERRLVTSLEGAWAAFEKCQPFWKPPG
jgi:triphosphatase